MRRVLVIGTSAGAGKTTLAGQLAERLGVPLIELDALFWGPNWSKAPTAEFRSKVLELTSGDGWVVDGNYNGRLGDLVWHRADTVVWLDMPLRLSLWRTLRRTVRRALTREELWSGNRENLYGAVMGRDALLVYSVRTHARHRRLYEERVASDLYPHLTVHRLRSPAEVDRWLAEGSTARTAQ